MSNREKDIKEEPIHRITDTLKYGKRPRGGERERDQKNEIVDNLMHQNGVRTINV